ncbi:DHH family phosphoesterase [Blattabacterium cuenoti]|uniref:DHH family phosphoesterase n=1 Tax=Blattabacterium cuenoti TaxID=1653831 RepID=UPI00163BB590|nr:bifunctional oligoribonuclease/PAP phosphatase NrnA [Blattabacterium cuenoti]
MFYYNISGIEKRKIVLLLHKNPDGDALGSSLALLFYFRKLNHDVDIISPTEYSDSFNWLPGIKNVLIFSKKNEDLVKKKFFNSDYIFLIDFNNISRINNLKKFFLYSKAKKILIDHHLSPISFDFMFFDPNVASTSIMIFRFISKMNNLDKIDNEIATCLYVGLMTDTGYFRFPSVTSETHFVAGKLMKIGININLIYNKLQETYHINKLKLLSIALNKLKIINKYRTTYTSIDYLDTKLCSYKIGDTEGIINYGLKIKNVVFSAFFFEEKKDFPIKISFRSKGNFDVNLFSRKYFGGGGHKNASGGILDKSLPETIEYFLKIIPIYYHNLMFSI